MFSNLYLYNTVLSVLLLCNCFQRHNIVRHLLVMGLSTAFILFSGACLTAIQNKPFIHFNHCIHINTPVINTKLIQIFSYCIILHSHNCSDWYPFPNSVGTYTWKRSVKCSMIENMNMNKNIKSDIIWQSFLVINSKYIHIILLYDSRAT